MNACSLEALLPSSRRPVPIRARSDLQARRIEYQATGTWVVKDPAELAYHRLLPVQYDALCLLDGQRSVKEIHAALRHRHPTLPLSLTDVQELITQLYRSGLAYSIRPGQAGELLARHRQKKWETWKRLGTSLLYIPLPGWDPERLLRLLYPFVSWAFRPWAVCLGMCLVLASWALLLLNWEPFRRGLPEFHQFFGWPNLLYVWLLIGAAKIVHELGHGLCCKHFGGECHQIGLMFLVFSPCLYCDVSDSWMLPNKWQRIAIGAAGMVVELVISAVALLVWWNTQPGLLHHLCLNLFFVTTVSTVIFNANPLLRYDGYYMLSDWLEIPNLRPQADRLLLEKIAWYCLGIELPRDPFAPQTRIAGFVAYAVAATLYRWIVLLGIAYFLCKVLKPAGLQSLGVMAASLAVGGILIGMMRGLYTLVATPRVEPMSRAKIILSSTAVLALAGASLVVPFARHDTAPLIVEAYGVRHLYLTVPGRLETVDVEFGQRVSEGQRLAQLSSPELAERRRVLERDVAIQELRQATFLAIGDTDAHCLASDRLANLKEQLAQLTEQESQLTITACCEGWVAAPPRREKPEGSDAARELAAWSGCPLDRRNVGCFLERQTHLLSIVPSRRYEATLLVDQTQRNDLSVGGLVQIKFAHLPERTYASRVAGISLRRVDFVPAALSNKWGGELPTLREPDGRERLPHGFYEATAPLDDADGLLLPGLRGRARFRTAQHTAAGWMWRSLRHTLRFRL